MKAKENPKGSLFPAGNAEMHVWRRPELLFLGKLAELVQGWGKTGPMDDLDPKETAKSGIG